MDVEKEIKKEEKKVQKFFSKKENIWMSVSIVLALAVIVMLIVSFTGNLSKTSAGNKMVTYLNTLVPEGDIVVLKSVKSLGSLYEITVTYKSQDIPVYMSKDGKYMINSIQEITSASTQSDSNSETPQEVPKSDKPTVQLYVWSYCPYGVQAQGPMAEVANLLKGKANFEIVPYYDGHGAYETQQNKIQLCIQKLASDKYWDYAKGFVANIYSKCGSSRDIACDKNESIALMKTLGINSVNIMSCVDSQGSSLFATASSKAQNNGVSGSPTIMINGVSVQTERTAESIKAAVCGAFNNSPTECSQTLSENSAATSGSC